MYKELCHWKSIQHAPLRADPYPLAFFLFLRLTLPCHFVRRICCGRRRAHLAIDDYRSNSTPMRRPLKMASIASVFPILTMFSQESRGHRLCVRKKGIGKHLKSHLHSFVYRFGLLLMRKKRPLMLGQEKKGSD